MIKVSSIRGLLCTLALTGRLHPRTPSGGPSTRMGPRTGSSRQTSCRSPHSGSRTRRPHRSLDTRETGARASPRGPISPSEGTGRTAQGIEAEIIPPNCRLVWIAARDRLDQSVEEFQWDAVDACELLELHEIDTAFAGFALGKERLRHLERFGYVSLG